MASPEARKSLVGGLTFFGSTLFQVALASVVRAIGQGSESGIAAFLHSHPYLALAILLLVSSSATAVALWLTSRHAGDHEESTRLIQGAAAELAEVIRDRASIDRALVEGPLGVLEVAWQNADDKLVDHWANITGDPDGHPIVLDGSIDILTTLNRVPSHRLVILGRPGSGKSTLLSAYARAVIASGADPTRLPVQMGLPGWDPGQQALHDWLATELVRQYPSLGRRVHDGRTVARCLIDANRIDYLLDGLDEMAGPLRAAALSALSSGLRRGERLIVTSRLAEYRASVAVSGPLARAAVITVCDLRPADVATYLRVAGGNAGGGSPWTPMLDWDDAAPGDPRHTLRAALTTPLMVQLAALSYREPGARPEELLALAEPAAIEEHLLDRYVATVLRPGLGSGSGGERARARKERYLVWIARHLDATHSPYLRWWTLADSLSTGARVRVGVAIAFLAGVLFAGCFMAGAMLGGVLRDPAYQVFDVLLEIAVSAAVPAAMLGALVAALSVTPRGTGIALVPVPVRLRRSWRSRRGNRTRTRSQHELTRLSLRVGLLAALTAGAVSPLQTLQLAYYYRDMPAYEVHVVGNALSDACYTFFTFTVVIWLVLQVAQLVEEPVDLSEVSSPRAMIVKDRNSGLTETLLSVVLVVAMSAFAIPYAIRMFWFGLGTLMPGLVNDSQMFWDPEPDRVPGLVISGLFVLLVVSAWGRYAIARTYWACLGKLPFRLLAFLEWARAAGILRQTGASYQFRHLKIQDRLATRRDDDSVAGVMRYDSAPRSPSGRISH